jgi:hypothetical protein
MSVNQPDETLTQFEQELTRAMCAVDPPQGFAERTMARAQEPGAPRARVLTMPRRSQFWASGAIAAAVLAGAFFGEQTHVRHERERAALAQQQFDTAMRITDETLDHVRLQLQQAGVSIGNQQKQ